MAPNLYYGNHERKLDYKGRVGLPDEMLTAGTWSRAVLLRSKAELPGFEPFPFLSLYDLARWQSILDVAVQKGAMDANEMRLFQHRIVADAATVDVDAMKRVTIPERLLDHAQIQKQNLAHFVGNFTNIEIWSPTVYSAHMDALEQLSVDTSNIVELARQADVQEIKDREEIG